MSTANLAQYGVSQGNIRQLFGEALVALGHANPDIVVLDCQTAMPTAAVAFAKAFPDRFIDLGIAEQNAVSFAAGLARMGFVPILPLFACFSSRRALDQVTIQAGYAGLNVKVCGLYAGLTSPNTGATHQMISDLAVMRSIPNMTVIEPADALEMSQALPAVVAHPGPVYFRLVRGDVGGPCPRVVPDGYAFQLGRAALLREGRDVTLIGSGLMVRTFQAMRQVQPGFTRPEEVLTLRVTIPEALVKEDDAIIQDKASGVLGRWGLQALGDKEVPKSGDLGLGVVVEPASIVAFGEDDFNTYVSLKPENGRVRYRYHGSWFKEPGAARSAKEYEEMLKAVARLRPEVRVGP